MSHTPDQTMQKNSTYSQKNMVAIKYLSAAKRKYLQIFLFHSLTIWIKRVNNFNRI